jgi:OOP family OmpA-OmpF porin
MKKIILTFVFASTLTTMSAQTETTQRGCCENNYNKWSVELAGGFNKPTKRMTPGYRTAVVSPYGS